MILGGFHRPDVIDFPGRLAHSCLRKLQTCVRYCHNRQLIAFRGIDNQDVPTAEHMLNLLSTRRRGWRAWWFRVASPRFQPRSLPVRAYQGPGYGRLIQRHESSVLRRGPARVLVDYVAMDVKHDSTRYLVTTGVAVPVTQLGPAATPLATSGWSYEFRTTVYPVFTTTQP